MAVIGAGLVGLCTALSLARRGARNVVLLDRGAIGGGATGASAGGLWPGHECRSLGDPAIARRAAADHARLRREVPCDFVASGLLELVLEGGGERAAATIQETREAGFEAEWVDGQALPSLEPRVRSDGGALYFPGDGSLHPLKLAAGVAGLLRATGGRICLGAAVERLEEGGTELVLAEGRLSVAATVVTAGAWTPAVTRLLRWSPPIRPMRGTLLSSPVASVRALRTIVMGPRFYYWQLASGPLAGGGSEEDVGFDESMDSATVDAVRSEFEWLFPTLRPAPFDRAWCGFRPLCEDLQPVIGRVPGHEQVFVAAGHFRKGILLAPLTGGLVADELLEGRRWDVAAPFRPERFAAA